MDNEYLLINFNLFTLNHNVSLIRENSANTFGYFSLEELPETIVNLCDEYETYQVKLHGVGKYLEILETEIKEEESKYYNMNKIEIEVI